MIAWLNLSCLLFSSLLFLYFYVRSVSPAGRRMVIGSGAYEVCGRERVVAFVFQLVVTLNYVLYRFFPIATRLPRQFPWSWGISIGIALTIGAPAVVLMVRGIRDAGEETFYPQEEQTLFGGIYQRIRHPQAVGEVLTFWVIAFLLHSPFLAIISFVFIPLYLVMCWAEEQDLLLRFGERYADYCRKTGAFFPKRQS